jgi:hypothetical protein
LIKCAFKTRICTQKLGKSPFCRSTVSRTEQVAASCSVVWPDPFRMMCGLITSIPISVTAHFEYPKNNSIGLSVLQSKVE